MLFPPSGAYYTYLNDYFGTTAASSHVIEIKKGLSRAKKYQVTVNGKDYVLRVLDPALPINRKQEEIAASVYAGQHKIGPQIHYIAPDGKA